MADVKITAQSRTEFGKGAARRTRRSGRVPAVLYGSGIDPVHLSFDTVEFAAVMRENGRNAVLTVSGVGKEQLALTKSVVRDPIKGFIEHVDLVTVTRGQKVQVDVPVITVGEAATGTLVFQNADTLSVEADALNIPEEISVVIDEAEIGTQFLAGEIRLPDGAELISDPEILVVNVTEAPTEDAMEEELDVEGAGVEEDAPEDEEGAEGAEGADGEGSEASEDSGSDDADSSDSDD